jgi:uncharacterized membrane protein
METIEGELMARKKKSKLLSTISYLTITAGIIAAALVLSNKEDSITLLAAFTVFMLLFPLIRQIREKTLLKAAWQYYLVYFIWVTIAILVEMILTPFTETLQLGIKLLITLVSGTVVTISVIVGNRIMGLDLVPKNLQNESDKNECQ